MEEETKMTVEHGHRILDLVEKLLERVKSVEKRQAKRYTTDAGQFLLMLIGFCVGVGILFISYVLALVLYFH